jgi:hypothetical protein
VQSKQGKLIEIGNIEVKLDNIFSRVENLEKLNSRYNKKSSQLEVVTSEQQSDLGNGQVQQVNSLKFETKDFSYIL